MSKAVVKEAFVGNKLLLPKQPHHDVFLQVMANVFRYSCWFGVMGSRRIIWRLWTVCVLCILMFVQCHAIWKVIKALAGWAVDMVGHRSVTARLSGTFFYATSIFSLLLCSRLCLSWQELSADWAAVERAMIISVPPDPSLKRRMVVVICFMTGFCLTEYAEWMAIPILIISILATALWNFQDLLIVLISMGLTSRYHRLNKCIAKICSMENKEIKWDKKSAGIKVYTWRRIREAYVRQAALVRKMDKALGIMVVLSSFSSFYFICLQLFMGITQADQITDLRRLFFLISLTWLSIRISSMVLAASDINVHSKKALKYIYDCDANCYNIEMERLQNQLTKDNVVLSGLGFFSLNRTILLQMAGAIITYELVLIQFDDGDFDETALLIDNGTTL